MTIKGILRALRLPIYPIVFVRLFSLWERMGFHITPNHFYQPIPDTRTLKDELWLRQSELIGLDMNEQNQIQLLHQFLRFKEEYDAFPKNKASKPYQYYINNPIFGAVDAEILYCMIRHFKPKKIIGMCLAQSTTISSFPPQQPSKIRLKPKNYYIMRTIPYLDEDGQRRDYQTTQT